MVLTPGIYNSAYFEHCFLAQQMGVELVEGRDLCRSRRHVFMRTTKGFERVDVIYRRIDDDFLDPAGFRADSLLGVPGLMDAYRAGRVALANAPGTGIADDKVDLRLCAADHPVLPWRGDRSSPTCRPTSAPSRRTRKYVLANLDKLVVKAANESGGYGMLVGPHRTAEQRDEFARRIQANPRNYIAQPTLALSRVPTIVGRSFRRPPRRSAPVHPLRQGHLRAARRPHARRPEKGSLVVNSSQGGGSKDTWVLQA